MRITTLRPLFAASLAALTLLAGCAPELQDAVSPLSPAAQALAGQTAIDAPTMTALPAADRFGLEPFAMPVGAFPVASTDEGDALAPFGDLQGHYIVVLQDDHADPAAFARAIGVTPTFVYEHALRGFAAPLPETLATALRAHPDVQWVEADREVKAIAQTTPFGIDRANADANTLAAIDGIDTRVDVDVAILDTGIDAAHPDLNVLGGINFTSATKTAWGDQNGHGTHVAGTTAALDNGIDVVGVAPGARLWAVRVLDRRGSGTNSGVIAGIDWVKANAATIEVANMSLGGGGSDDGNCGNSNNDAEHKAICSAVAAGVTFVVAAGNESTNAANSTPAAYDEVITVSALADFDGKPGRLGTGSFGFSSCTEAVDDSFACFSNFGADVDILAPGVGIVSTKMGGGTTSMSGTSMASPHVAGAAALIKAANPSFTPAQVRQALLSKAAVNPCGTGMGASCTDDPDGIQEPLLDVASPGHDLAIASFTAPASAAPGAIVTATVQVSNQGGFADTAEITVTDTTTGTVIGTAVAALAQGETQSFAFDWDTTGAALGGHALQAAIAPVADETDLADNTASRTVNLTEPSHDVAVQGLTVPASAQTGNALQLGVAVANVGTFAETFDVTLTANGAAVGTQTVTLAAGASAALSFPWTAGAAGSYTFEAAAGPVAEETLTADNAATATLTVAAAQTLDVTVATNKASYINAETVAITTTVKSAGAPVSGASVAIQLTTAKGTVLSGSATTNASGIATLNYKVNSKSHGVGTYQVKSTATKAGYVSGEGTTSFAVTK